jgi:large subunit ribosomal protein L3
VSVGILGNKVGMTQIFDEHGNASAVTVIKAGPCAVTQIKTISTAGYNAIQIGYGQVNSLTQPELGHLRKSGVSPLKYLSEYKVDDTSEFELGQVVDTNIFSEGQILNVTGKSIGKGFSGTIKRHHFTRGPMSHGSKNHRAPGSIGAGTTPGRVYPGKKMPGRLGGKTVTVLNLKILKIDVEENLIIVKGSIPGKPGNLLSLQSAS